jgi:hypothetical protein
MGKSRYDKPIIPWSNPEAPLDLSDPVEKLISDVRAIWKKVEYFPEKTPENWISFIELRNIVPELCRTLRYTNDRLKELCPDERTPSDSGSSAAKS